MDTGEWLDKWLESKTVSPRTTEKYFSAIAKLKETVAFADLADITPELVDKATSGDPGLRSVLSMALGQAVKGGLISKNIAALKREQRKPQEGSLYYRADRKAWVAQVTITDQSGKQIKKRRLIKVDRKTRVPPDAAIRALEELRAIKDAGGMVQELSTVGELIEKWLSTISVKGPDQAEGLAPATFEQYKSIATHQILPYLGRTKLKDLNRYNIDRWLATLQKSTYITQSGQTRAYTSNTLRLSRVVLSAAVGWATKERLLAYNPVRDSKPPGGRPKAKKHAMSEEQAKRLIEKTRGTPLGPLWAFMVTTGLRRGEALGLRWSDYDGESIIVTSQLKIEGGQVTRGDLKTERSKRSLRLPKFLVADLEAHRSQQRQLFDRLGQSAPELMFPSSSGNPIRPDNLRKRFLTALREAGIEPHEDGRPWTVHELRHTAASQLLADRMPIQIVSKALGHSSVRVTIDVYSHLSDKDTELLADSMEGRFGGNSVTER